MDVTVQIDFAKMALKGKRYNEAETIYMQIATQNNSPEAWIGLGFCKMYQLADGRTMEEVIFCLDKAKVLSPQSSSEIDNQLITNCQIILSSYIKVFEEAIIKQKALNKAAQKGALLAGVSLGVGLSSKSRFTKVASIVGTGVGVGVAVDAISKMNSISEIQKFILNKCNHIDVHLKKYVDASSPNLVQYNNFILEVNDTINHSVKSLEAQKKWWANLTTVILLTIFLWPVGLYGWFCRIKNRQLLK